MVELLFYNNLSAIKNWNSNITSFPVDIYMVRPTFPTCMYISNMCECVYKLCTYNLCKWELVVSYIKKFIECLLIPGVLLVLTLLIFVTTWPGNCYYQCPFYVETDAERLNSVPTSQILTWHNWDISSGNNVTPELMLFTSILAVILSRLLHKNNNKKSYILSSIYLTQYLSIHPQPNALPYVVQTRQTCSNTYCTFLYMLAPTILNIRIAYPPYHQSVKTLIFKSSFNDNSSM